MWPSLSEATGRTPFQHLQSKQGSHSSAFYWIGCLWTTQITERHKQSGTSFILQVIFAEFRHWLAGSLSKRQQLRVREQWSVWVRQQTEQCMVQGSHQWICVCLKIVLCKTDSSCGIFEQIPNSFKWITTLLQWSKVYPHFYLAWRTRTDKSQKNLDSRPWKFALPSFWTGSRYADNTY